MAKIIKVGPHTITPNKTANPFRTSRSAITNPFEYTNFEGNTLQFADVFEGFEPKQVSKLKMIASSVAGSMNKMHSSIIEPITAFVSRVKGGVLSAWNYANNTNVSDLPIIKDAVIDVKAWGENVSAKMSSIGTNVSGIGKSLASTLDILNMDVTDIGKGLSEKWTALISKYNTSKISAETPVAELEQMLKSALEGVA